MRSPVWPMISLMKAIDHPTCLGGLEILDVGLGKLLLAQALKVENLMELAQELRISHFFAGPGFRTGRWSAGIESRFFLSLAFEQGLGELSLADTQAELTVDRLV